MILRALNPLVFLDKRKSILLLGPRGTGKTALIGQVVNARAKNMGERLIQIDLLRGGDFQRYLGQTEQLTKEVETLIKRLPKDSDILVVIDEVQRIPALLNEAHFLIEKYKDRIVFLLTGSSARKLRRGGANLLAGRAISCQYFPLSELEIDLELNRALRFGTMPGVYLDTMQLEIPTLESYVSTYLREEIQQESLVRGIDRFAKFLEFAAQQNGQPVNYAKLGKTIGIAGKTVSEYYSILSDTLLATHIPGWSESVRRQLLQSPRYYFFDCGVLNAINGYLRIEMRGGGFIYGNLFETFVVNQLIAANHFSNLGLRFFYWRDKEGKEVDLILARNQFEPLLAVEIKSSSMPQPEDCSGFRPFSEEYPAVPRICVCTTPRSYSAGEVDFLPWQELVKGLSSYITVKQ